VGTVDSWENGIAHCQQRGKWSLGDTLEALCPDGRSIALTPEWIENEAGERVESTPHAMEKYTMPTPELPPMSLLRRKTV
jgi:putative protease